MLDVIADRLLGARAGDMMGIVSIISIAASISAMTFAGPRVYYAMARDGLFFRGAAARFIPGIRRPPTSIVAQAMWSGLLVLSGGAQCADDLHRLCRRAVCGRRGGGALRAARSVNQMRRVRSARGAIRSRPPSSHRQLPSSSTRCGRISSVPIMRATPWGPAAAG